MTKNVRDWVIDFTTKTGRSPPVHGDDLAEDYQGEYQLNERYRTSVYDRRRDEINARFVVAEHSRDRGRVRLADRIRRQLTTAQGRYESARARATFRARRDLDLGKVPRKPKAVRIEQANMERVVRRIERLLPIDPQHDAPILIAMVRSLVHARTERAWLAATLFHAARGSENEPRADALLREMVRDLVEGECWAAAVQITLRDINRRRVQQ